jgi:hypothetical protein
MKKCHVDMMQNIAKRVADFAVSPDRHAETRIWITPAELDMVGGRP